MNKKETIQFLRAQLDEIPTLAKLPYNNGDYPLWRNQIEDVLENVFNRDSIEYQRFAKAYPTRPRTSSLDRSAEKKWYLDELELCKIVILSIIKKHELLGIEEKPSTTGVQPKAFIAHGGKSEARDKLYRFLSALGVTPLIIDEEAREGRSVNEQVEYCSQQADCAIILGTADDKELKDGKLYPRRNVHIEIGRFQERFPNRIIYLLEEGASFPSDISEKLYTRFTQGSMDEAFITVARELKAFGMLNAVKP